MACIRPFFIQVSILTSVLFSSSGDRSTFRLEKGKTYTLKSWPDSAYIANLDSMAAAEPLKAPEKNAPEISISPINYPTMSPQKNPAGQKPVDGAVAKPTPEKEQLAERFQAAVEKLLAEPSNVALYREITVEPGEDWPTFLKRAYGPNATQLPIFVVKSQLQSINGPEFKAGQVMRVPKL